MQHAFNEQITYNGVCIHSTVLKAKGGDNIYSYACLLTGDVLSFDFDIVIHRRILGRGSSKFRKR